MKDKSKYITISLPASTWSHCFVGIEGNLETKGHVTRGNLSLQLAMQFLPSKNIAGCS